MRAPVGEINQAETRTVIGRGLSAVRVEKEMRGFLWHALKRAAPQLNRIAQGSTFTAVGRSEVEALEIPWSDPQTCSRIAAVLDTLDAAIAQTEAIIAKLKQVRAGLLHDLLTRGLDEHGQLHPPPAEAPHLYQDSPLGKIPREWEVGNLGSKSQYVTSGSRGWANYYSNDGPLFLRIGNLTREHINFRFEDIVCVRPPAGSEGARTRTQTDDILISITADLGIIGVVPAGFGEAYVNQHIALVRPSVGVNSRWLGRYLAAGPAARQFQLIKRLRGQGWLEFKYLTKNYLVF